MSLKDYQLLALDLDDTLLNKKNKLSKKTVEVIEKIKDKGVTVTIATGRMLTSSLPYIKKLNIQVPVITYNGAYVRDIQKQKTIYHQPLSQQTAEGLIRDAQKENLHVNYYHEDKLYVTERNRLSALYEDIAGVQAKEVKSFAEFKGKQPTKILIIEDDQEKKERFFNYCKEKYKGKAEIKKSKEYFIEFTDNGVSKGRSLAELADDYLIPQEKVVAIGDGWNDADMIEWAGLGIAMGNASPGVQEKADLIAPDHDNEGVAEILAEVFKLD